MANPERFDGLCCKRQIGHSRGRSLPGILVAGRDDGGTGRCVQGTALHVRGDPVGAALVSGLPDQLPRSLCDVVGSRHCGRSHHAVRLGAGPMLPSWNSGSGVTCGPAPGRGERTRPTSKVRGVWTYLYRAVDSLGQTIDVLLSARRDAAAAKRFFRKALAQPHTANPRTITVDKNPAYLPAAADMKRAGELWRFSKLRQRK